MAAFPSRLPEQNTVQRVYKAHYRGRPLPEIVKRLDVDRRCAARWLNRADWYYPWEDHVVIDRMLAGNAEAFAVGTAWERRRFLEALGRKACQPDNLKQHLIKLGHSLGLGESLYYVMCGRVYKQGK